MLLRAVLCALLALCNSNCRARAHASNVSNAPLAITGAAMGVTASEPNARRTGARATPPRADAPTPAWTLETRIEHIEGVGSGMQVFVHAPEGFDRDAPLDLVLYLHGAHVCAAQFIADDTARCGDALVPGLGGARRHDAAHTNTLLIVPQWDVRDGEGFRREGFLRAFLADLLAHALAAPLGRACTLDEVRSITLLGHSAGGFPVRAVLARGGLGAPIRNVALLDAFLAPDPVFAAWLDDRRATALRRFVSIYGGSIAAVAQSRAFADERRARYPSEVAVDPREGVAPALRAHRVVVAMTGVEHGWIPLAYMTKVLEGFDLPPRRPPAATAAQDHAPVGVVATGTEPRTDPATLSLDNIPREGALEARDARMRDGAAADEYTLDLVPGEPVEIAVHGGPAPGDYTPALDVYAELLFRGFVVAADDDGGGGFAARVLYAPSLRGRYVLRVTTHGGGLREGPYVVRARRR